MPAFETVTGYRPGLIGRISQLHAHYYSEYWGFGPFFEAKVASELSRFITDYDPARDCIRTILHAGIIEGSIAVQHEPPTDQINNSGDEQTHSRNELKKSSITAHRRPGIYGRQGGPEFDCRPTSEAITTAHLRWFLVSDRLRGQGAGNCLLKEAVSFSRKAGYRRISLWTFQGLDSARHLYEKSGFILAEERTGSQWGTTVMEQRFELPL
jgi:hypothetical protein